MARIAASMIAVVLAGAAFAQAPEMILGTEDEQYKLFTPQAVVEAGGGSDTPYSTTDPAAPGTPSPGSQNAASRGDHVHPRQADPDLSDEDPAPTGAAAAAGAGTSASREDHVHGVTFSQLPPKEAGAAGAGSSAIPARSDHVHPAELLPLGVAGACLRVNTSRTDAIWTTCPSGGGSEGVTAYKFFAQEPLAIPQIVTNTNINANSPRSWTILAKKTFSQGLIVGPFVTQYEGIIRYQFKSAANLTAQLMVRHTLANGKTITSTRTFVTRASDQEEVIPLSQFSSITQLRLGDVMADDGSTVTITAALLAQPVDIDVQLTFTVGSREVLESMAGQNARVTWWQLNQTESQITLDDDKPKVAGTAAAGVAAKASRGDHVHPTQPLSTFGTVGTQGQCAKANASRDGLQYGDCGSPRVLTNKLPKASGTAAPGTDTQVSRSDHVHPGGGGEATPLSDATPTATNAAADAGTSTAASRGDHIHNVTYSGLPPKIAGTAAAGSSEIPARSDHVHPSQAVPAPATTTPVATGTSGAVGTSASYARADHRHEGAGGASLSNRNPSELGTVSPGTGTMASRDDHVHPRTGIPTPQAATPLPIGTAATGIGLRYARSDHVHATASSATPKPLGTAASGTSAGASRDDHVHGPYALPDLTGHAGRCLKVNSAATALEAGDCGGSGGGGGGTWTTFASGESTSIALQNWITLINDFTDEQDAALLELAKTQTQMVLIWELTTPTRNFDDGNACYMFLDTFDSNGTVRARGSYGATNRAYFNQNEDWACYIDPGASSNGLSIYENSVQTAGRHIKWVLKYLDQGSGGGGGDTPVIPKPSSSVANRLLEVNESGVYALTAPSSVVSAALGNRQVPTIAEANRGQYLRVKSDSDATEWGALPPPPSSFYEMLSGQWQLSDNNVDYTISSDALHKQLSAANAPKLMHFIFRFTGGNPGVNYAYLLNCPGADTPLGATESRTFACFGWRERTGQGIPGEIAVSPTAYRVKVSNIDARANNSVNFKLWGQR